jgi:hypothetical protein
MYQLDRAEQNRLETYCLHRIEQFQEFEPILGFFGVEHKMEPYIDGLNNVLRELEGKNDNNTKLDNAVMYIPHIFFDDLSAICQGTELPLPDSLLEIPEYLAVKEREKQEEEKRRQDEQEAQERQALQEKWRQRALKEKERKRAEICEQLGIDPIMLEKLTEV